MDDPVLVYLNSSTADPMTKYTSLPYATIYFRAGSTVEASANGFSIQFTAQDCKKIDFFHTIYNILSYIFSGQFLW